MLNRDTTSLESGRFKDDSSHGESLDIIQHADLEVTQSMIQHKDLTTVSNTTSYDFESRILKNNY